MRIAEDFVGKVGAGARDDSFHRLPSAAVVDVGHCFEALELLLLKLVDLARVWNRLDLQLRGADQRDWAYLARRLAKKEWLDKAGGVLDSEDVPTISSWVLGHQLCHIREGDGGEVAIRTKRAC